MVKGVSKTVIVVNNTGSKLFEKIVFYVTPEYGNLSAKQLKKAASSFSFNYDSVAVPTLRKRYRKKRMRLILAISLAALLSIGLLSLILLLI